MAKKNKTYWLNRQEQWLTTQDKDDERISNRLEKDYQRTAKELEKDISTYFNRYGQDNVIEFRTMLQDLGQEDRNLLFQDMDRFAEKYPQYADLMPVRQSVYQLNRLEGLHYSTQMKLLELGAVEQEELERHLEKTYGKHYQNMLKELGIGNQFLAIDDMTMRNTLFTGWVNGENFSDRIWTNKEKMLDHMQTVYRDGLARGDNYARLTKAIQERFDVGSSDAKRLVWTESSFMLNQAHTQAYELAGVEEYEISAIRDNKTSPICREMDGEVFRFDEKEVGLNFPPFHPYCRTTFIGLIDDNEITLNVLDSDSAGERVLFTENIKGNMSSEESAQLEKILNESPEEVKRLWSQIQGDLVTVDKNSKKSYYKSGEGVYFNFAADSKNESLTRRNGEPVLGKANYTTFFHEYGHHIDDLFGYDDTVKRKTRVGRKTMSYDLNIRRYKSYEIGLSQSIRGEINETIEKFGANNIDDLAVKLTEYAQVNYPYGYNGVSDILSGLSDNRANMGWQHSSKYWRRKDNDSLGKEAFAHMYASHTTQGEADGLMKEVFPKSYDKVISFIKEAVT